MTLRRLCAAVALVSAGLASYAAPIRADAFPPVMFVTADDSRPGDIVGLDFATEYLGGTGEPERLVISIPLDYGIGSPAGGQGTLGPASITAQPLKGGPKTTFRGNLVAIPAPAFNLDALAEKCAPGTHLGTWEALTHAGATLLEVPVALDQTSTSYTLSMCFDAAHALGLVVQGFDFDVRGATDVFTLPQLGGIYLFDGIVTPYGANGAADVADAFEVRAYTPLAQELRVQSARYARRTKRLTVAGWLTVRGAPTDGATISLYSRRTPTGPTRFLGRAETRGGGYFSFKKRLASFAGYGYVYGSYDPDWQFYCTPPFVAQVCESTSYDGTASYLVRVRAGR